MTTTIIIAAAEKMPLFNLFFNMRSCCTYTANILPPGLKNKNRFIFFNERTDEAMLVSILKELMVLQSGYKIVDRRAI